MSIVTLIKIDPVINTIFSFLAPVDVLAFRYCLNRYTKQNFEEFYKSRCTYSIKKYIDTILRTMLPIQCSKESDDTLLEQVVPLDDVLESLKRTKSNIAGGFVLSCIMGRSWQSADLDVYTYVGDADCTFCFRCS